MFTTRIVRCALALVTFATLTGAAVADAASDCRSTTLEPAALLTACDAAIASATDPVEEGDLLAERAGAHRQLGNVDAAREDIEKAIHLAPGDADPWIEQGYLLRDEGDAAGAAEALEQAVSIDPDYPRAVLVAMDLSADAGEFERCLELATRAVEIAPERAHTWAFRGRCESELGRDEEAVADYEKAAEIGLEEAFLYDNLSRAYLRLGRAAEAEAAAGQAVSLDPANFNANLSLIEALMGQGKVEEALAAYHVGEAALPPEEIDLANDMTWMLYLAGEYDRALSIIEPWIEAHPHLTSDYVWEVDTYAHVLAAMGQVEKAVATFLLAAELGGPEKRAAYETNLRSLGFDPGQEDASFEAALRTCAEAGASCQLDV